MPELAEAHVRVRANDKASSLEASRKRSLQTSKLQLPSGTSFRSLLAKPLSGASFGRFNIGDPQSDFSRLPQDFDENFNDFFKLQGFQSWASKIEVGMVAALRAQRIG